jgi:L-arabinokinase
VSRTVFFYVSGHGFGHTIRQIAVMTALAARTPGVQIFVRTTAPSWLLERSAPFAYTLLNDDTDTGVVQRDSLTLDESETIRRASAFYTQLEIRACDEARLLERHGAHVVITDAPPLACAAASLAGIPSFVCANFTWDWIYEGYSPPRDLITAIGGAYRRATAGWRMPMHGGFESIESIVDIPFVARHARVDLPRDEVRRTLGLPVDRRLALISFGGYGLEGLRLDSCDCLPSWQVVTTARQRRCDTSPDAAVLTVAERAIYSAGLRYEDLVRAVDVVVTKPGYGIIADCVANGTAMLYTSRGRFAEYDVLVSEMPRYLRSRFIETDDLRAGRWRQALDTLMRQPMPPERPRTDGANVVAEMISACL